MAASIIARHLMRLASTGGAAVVRGYGMGLFTASSMLRALVVVLINYLEV